MATTVVTMRSSLGIAVDMNNGLMTMLVALQSKRTLGPASQDGCSAMKPQSTNTTVF